MISDEDVMRLFEQADPARRPDRANGHVAGAGYLTALREQRSIDMTITESPQTEPQSSRPRHWAFIGAAAAVAALVIGLVAVVARDDEPPTPADPPPAPTTSPSEVEAVEIAEQFYGALNDRDLATLQTLMGDDGVYDGIPVADMPPHLAALEAWDWTWEEVACEPEPEPADAGVRCEIAARNRLTELIGTELSGSSLFTVTDGTIGRVNLDGLDFSDYSPNAFMPFQTWVRENHPDDYQTIWEENDSFRQTPESAALLDQHLTDYANEVRADVDVAERFYGALNDRGLASLQTLMGSDGVYDGIVVEDMPAHIAALEAWDWEWDGVACEPDTVEADVRCEIAVRNRLTDLTGTELVGFSLLTMTDGTIDRVNLDGLDFSDYSPNAFMPFQNWLRDNHPDDYQTIFEDNDPARQTTESATLLDQHLTDYANEVRAEAEG